MDLHFNVAEQTYCISFVDEQFPHEKFLQSSAPFRVEPTEREVMFRLSVGENLVDDNVAELEELGHFDSGDTCHHVWRKPDGGYKILIENFTHVIAARLECTFDFKECKVSLFGSQADQYFGLENSIMIAYAFAGAQHRLVLIHASVPMKDGKAYMFQGHSGTGKSTHSKLWLTHLDGIELLNDDNPVVRVDASGKVYTYGTPWSGKTPCYRQIRCESGGFLRLHQAPHNKIRRFSKLEAFASVLASCSTMKWDKFSYNAICDTVSAIAATVPAYDLECLPNQEAAELSHQTMTQGYGN
ncbi:MAG: hypothetical protein HUK09_04780 [Bacteroidaceae bacterium]|nr:hypothetical protein [Bacteroidaceae bacterium]